MLHAMSVRLRSAAVVLVVCLGFTVAAPLLVLAALLTGWPLLKPDKGERGTDPSDPVERPWDHSMRNPN